jgi:hypothetical protein
MKILSRNNLKERVYAYIVRELKGNAIHKIWLSKEQTTRRRA